MRLQKEMGTGKQDETPRRRRKPLNSGDRNEALTLHEKIALIKSDWSKKSLDMIGVV